MKRQEIDLAVVCPRYHHAVELIGRRWTGAILMVLLQGTSRFTDIVHAVPGLSDRLLSERLKELEAEGIVQRIVHAEMPVRIEYQLTPMGRDLSNVTEAVSCWAERWLPGHEEARELATVGIQQESQ
jgi:DNA-binding HxlR family transcriptional regulator